MNSIIPFISLCLISILGYGQGLDGVSIKNNESDNLFVKSKTRYRIIPSKNSFINSEMTFFEKFDSLGKVIEEMDFHDDGKLYEWNFFTYDYNNNVIEKKILYKDSSLNLNEVSTYDNQNRYLLTTSVDSTGVIKHKSVYTYDKKKRTYIGWFGDSLDASTQVEHLNKFGYVTHEIWYNGTGNRKIKNHETYYSFKDTILIKKKVLHYAGDSLRWGELFKYDSKKHTMKEYSINHLSIETLIEKSKFDAYGNKIFLEGYKNDTLWYKYFWNNKYDNLGRRIEIEKYVGDSSNIQSIKYAYEENINGERIERIEECVPKHISIAPCVNTITTRVFDKKNNWLSTTKTVNGILVKYHYAVYVYGEK